MIRKKKTLFETLLKACFQECSAMFAGLSFFPTPDLKHTRLISFLWPVPKPAAAYLDPTPFGPFDIWGPPEASDGRRIQIGQLGR